MSIVLNLAAGRGQKISVSTVSAQSAVLTDSSCVVHTSVDCYVRQGADPTAVADGSDQFIPAGALIRLGGLARGNRLAIIAVTSGTVHLMPGA